MCAGNAGIFSPAAVFGSAGPGPDIRPLPSLPGNCGFRQKALMQMVLATQQASICRQQSTPSIIG